MPELFNSRILSYLIYGLLFVLTIPFAIIYLIFYPLIRLTLFLSEREGRRHQALSNREG